MSFIMAMFSLRNGKSNIYHFVLGVSVTEIHIYCKYLSQSQHRFTWAAKVKHKKNAIHEGLPNGNPLEKLYNIYDI